MIDLKLDYLIKTLSRTKKKDYENYVVNAIWQRLGNLDIKPVTQQYIKRTNGSYALLDMYFPQINFGLEVDEPHHKTTITLDMIRQLDIQTSIEILDEPKQFILRRIDLDQSFENVDQQINSVVSELKAIIQLSKVPAWNFDQNPSTLLQTKRNLSVSDEIRFRRIEEIANGFGLVRFKRQSGYFKLNGKYWIWCPNLATTVEGELRSQGSHGWLNVLADNRNKILEYRLDPNEMEGLERQDNYLRITFARSKDVLGRRLYRFIGIYEFSSHESTHEKRIYTRISESLTFNELGI